MQLQVHICGDVGIKCDNILEYDRKTDTNQQTDEQRISRILSYILHPHLSVHAL